MVTERAEGAAMEAEEGEVVKTCCEIFFDAV